MSFMCINQVLRAGKPAIIRRNLGSKALKMIYCDDPSMNDVLKLLMWMPAERIVIFLK